MNNQPENGTAAPITGIMRTSLLNMFQIKNPEFYEQTENIPLESSEVSMARNILENLGLKESFHFHELAPTSDITLHLLYEQSGTFAMFLDYNIKQDINEKRSLMVIGNVASTNAGIDDEEMSVAPHFILSGYNTPIEDGSHNTLFVPENVICRVRDETALDDKMVYTANDEAIVAAMCYADQAIRAIAAEEPIDLYTNQEWLNESALETAAKHYLSIKDRTPESFQRELVISIPDTTHQDIEILPPNFFVPGPRTLQ